MSSNVFPNLYKVLEFRFRQFVWDEVSDGHLYIIKWHLPGGKIGLSWFIWTESLLVVTENNGFLLYWSFINAYEISWLDILEN